MGPAFAGAVVITLGMFMPCFLFTIAGHHLLEKLVRNRFLAPFFDGLCGAVIGVIAVVAIDILKSSVQGSSYIAEGKALVIDEALIRKLAQSGVAAVLYVGALGVLYKFTNKWTVFVVLAAAAIAGQFLFVNFG